MERQCSPKVKKIVKIVLNVLFYSFIVVLLLFSIANMRVRTNADIPSIFGTGLLAVTRDSMEGNEEDSFNVGDLLFVNICNDTERQALAVGDIVTFYDTDLRGLNTHRIVEIDGNFIFTQGDRVAVDHPDKVYDPDVLVNDENYYELVTRDEILSVHRSTWGGAGKTLLFLQSPVGFALFIVLPTFLVLVYEGILLSRNILKINRSKMEAKHQEEMKSVQEQLEKEKEALRAKIIEEMKQEENK
jgi:signal peptidase